MGLFIWPPGNTTFVAEVRPPEIIEEAWYFVFEGNQILLRHDADGRWTPIDSQEWTAMSTVDAVTHYMGRLQGRHCFAVSVAGLPNAQKSGLRGVLGSTDNLMFGLAGRAAQIVDWYRTHRFCGRCGGQNRPHDADRAMICDDCRLHLYPRLSPSIIVLIYQGDRILLARNHRFPPGMYSTIAGFVEPGESIEETLVREVKEEVGVNVRHLEYQGSQPWPFPNSLMLGFLAEYESGDIRLQEEEIEDAQWFDCDRLPDIPGKVAISRWLIDTYLARIGLPV